MPVLPAPDLHGLCHARFQGAVSARSFTIFAKPLVTRAQDAIPPWRDASNALGSDRAMQAVVDVARHVIPTYSDPKSAGQGPLASNGQSLSDGPSDGNI